MDRRYSYLSSRWDHYGTLLYASRVDPAASMYEGSGEKGHVLWEVVQKGNDSAGKAYGTLKRVKYYLQTVANTRMAAMVDDMRTVLGLL